MDVLYGGLGIKTVNFNFIGIYREEYEEYDCICTIIGILEFFRYVKYVVNAN
jgi:hypothetical protein